MSQVDLSPHGLVGYKIDKDGVVYGKSGKPLQFQYTGRGFRAVPVSGRKVKRGTYRIDRLLGAAFHNVEIHDESVQPVYLDGDVNNVSLDNLLFKRN